MMKCPCGTKLQAPAKYAGHEIKCPKCSTILLVPAPPTAAIVVDDPLMQPTHPGQMQQGQMQQGQMHPGQMHPGQMQQGQMHPGQMQQGYMPPPGAQGGHWSAGAHNARSKKPKRKTSPVLLASVVGGIVLLFGVGLLGFFLWEKSNSANSAVVRSKSGQIVDTNNVPDTPMNISVEDQRRYVPAPAIPPSKPNSFDSGESFADSMVESSDVELSMQDLIAKVEPSIVLINVESFDGKKSIGSGFFVGTEGKIITNYHVVQGAKTVLVQTADGEETIALGYLIADSQRDLAVIQINPDQLSVTPISIGNSALARGEEVAAFGSPQGFRFSATEGIVSGLREGDEVSDILKQMSSGMDIYGQLGYSVETSWIQTSTAISGGNSGGPLVNMRGEMVGVNTWTHPGGQNLNFASTADEVKTVFDNRSELLQPFEKIPRRNYPQMRGR